MSKNRRATLESTLQYLETTINTKEYTVEGLAYQLIYRIENFLPETCKHCNEIYCYGIHDIPLLSCSVCGQGAHTPCVYDLLHVRTEDRPSFTPEDAYAKINPLLLPELQYLCMQCIEEYLPDKNEGLLKRLPKDRAQRNQTQPTTHNHSGGAGEPSTDENRNPANHENGNQTDTSEVTHAASNGADTTSDAGQPPTSGPTTTGGLFPAPPVDLADAMIRSST